MPVGGSVRAALMAATHIARGAVPRCGQVELQRDGVLPRMEREVISVTPAIAPSDRSSGVATVAAMVSGAGPGQAGADRDGGVVHLRQQGHGQQEERHGTRQGQAQGEGAWCQWGGG